MTKEEAQRAAATFEFPPFRATAERTLQLGVETPQGDQSIHEEWALMVTNAQYPNSHRRVFKTTEAWRNFYATWKAMP